MRRLYCIGSNGERTLKVKIVIRGVDDLCRGTNGKTQDVQDVSKVLFSLENFIGRKERKINYELSLI